MIVNSDLGEDIFTLGFPKALAKEMKRRKQADADRNDDDDQGAIIRASLKAAKKKGTVQQSSRIIQGI